MRHKSRCRRGSSAKRLASERVRQAAGAFVGQLGKLRPIVNRPDAALAPDGGGSQPPRLPVAGPIAPPGGRGRLRGGRVGVRNIVGLLTKKRPRYPSIAGPPCNRTRSEDQRVGKECRSRWSP